MVQVQKLTTTSLISLVSNPRALYFLGYSWVFGMSVWVTFFNGIIAIRTLPRQQFGNFQHKVFPIYFGLTTVIPGALLFEWTRTHPNVVTHLFQPNFVDVAQAYALLTVVVTQSCNYFIIGPLTSKIMHARAKREKEEGKQYNESGVSNEMKALTRRFGKLHGISSLANLTAVIALAFHGLWIGSTWN